MACLREKFSNGVILDGRYKTIAPLNHGSFGMVFIATDMVTAETVAIKCLTKKSAANEAGFDFAVDDKSEEFALHSRLGSHHNIVNLVGSFETEVHLFLVLEFCQRGDLYEAIRNGHGPLETEHVRRFMLELVDAVSYIHSKGVYHRDIKPENIFLTHSGSMKLGDFGLATTERWTMESTVGSDRYMSPEQYDSAGAGYSPAQADIWAIGVCLLNILFSRNPFTTPTEEDPIFLDFSRDKQSLFDVFPSMSQDTYEVIVECMNLDPQKRSLVGARRALSRVVSFTTSDEDMDEFCSAERRAVATAYREPLRTPSIQSPHVDQGAFPWAKAFETAPLSIRKLSAIPDNETYDEDLFPRSEETADWCSRSAQTPSMSSMLDSSLGASMQSLAISKPYGANNVRYPRRESNIAGSLPIAVGKPRTLAATSFAFGGRQKGLMSKSWSDMWDEEMAEDAEEEDRTTQIEKLKEFNSRTWSHESTNPTTTTDATRTDAADNDKTISALSQDFIRGDVDADLGPDGFFFHEIPPLKSTPTLPSQPRYSPPSKRSAVDKWAALGERRRAVGMTLARNKTPDVSKPVRRQDGFGNTSQVETGGATAVGNWEHNHNHRWNKDKGKARPWNKGRDWNWRRERPIHIGDVEWVGAWQEAHS